MFLPRSGTAPAPNDMLRHAFCEGLGTANMSSIWPIKKRPCPGFPAVQLRSVGEIIETAICLDRSVTIFLWLQLKSNAGLRLVSGNTQHPLALHSGLLTWSPHYPSVEMA